MRKSTDFESLQEDDARRRRQFSLRALLVAVTSCCVVFAFLAAIHVLAIPVLLFISGYVTVLIGGDRDARLIWVGLGLVAGSAVLWYIIVASGDFNA